MSARAGADQRRREKHKRMTRTEAAAAAGVGQTSRTGLEEQQHRPSGSQEQGGCRGPQRNGSARARGTEQIRECGGARLRSTDDGAG